MSPHNERTSRDLLDHSPVNYLPSPPILCSRLGSDIPLVLALKGEAPKPEEASNLVRLAQRKVVGGRMRKGRPWVGLDALA